MASANAERVRLTYVAERSRECTGVVAPATTTSTQTTRRQARPHFLQMDLEDLHTSEVDIERNERIAHLTASPSLADLYEHLLDGLEARFGHETVAAVLPLVWASRRGLSLDELVGISGRGLQGVAGLQSSLSSHLLRRGGLLTFAHRVLREVVEARYVGDDPKRRRDLHMQIADWFAARDMDGRRAEEEPFQLLRASALDRLARFVAQPEALALLGTEERRSDLVTYWTALEGMVDPVDSYRATVSTIEQKGEEHKDLRLLTSLMTLYAELGRRDAAEALRRPQEAVERRIGAAQQQRRSAPARPTAIKLPLTPNLYNRVGGV